MSSYEPHIMIITQEEKPTEYANVEYSEANDFCSILILLIILAIKIGQWGISVILALEF